jgi:hypothetical protein
MARIKYVLQERRRAIAQARRLVEEAEMSLDGGPVSDPASGEPSFAEAAEEAASKADASSSTASATSGPAFMDGKMPPTQPGSHQQQANAP